MSDKNLIYKAIFAAARVAARTLVLQPGRIQSDLLARKAVGAAAQVVGRAAGKAAASLAMNTVAASSRQVGTG